MRPVGLSASLGARGQDARRMPGLTHDEVEDR